MSLKAEIFDIQNKNVDSKKDFRKKMLAKRFAI